MIKQIDFNYQDIERYNTLVLCYLNNYVDPIYKAIKEIKTDTFSVLECVNYNNAMKITDWDYQLNQDFLALKQEYQPNFLLNFSQTKYQNQTLDHQVEFKENYKFMALDLKEKPNYEIELKNNVQIVRVKEQETLNSFIHIVDVMEANLVSDKHKFVGLLELQEQCYMYLIKVDNQFVGTASLFLFDNGHSVIDDINVLPEFRNQGLASALMKTLINDSLAKEMHHICLFASEMGMGLYQKLGFIDENFWFEQYKIKS